MIRKRFALVTVLSLATLSPATSAVAQSGITPADYVNEQPRYSANQLDNLVGPIALYPDALLAQVLVAATFPDQIQEAARYVRANGTAGIDEQSWDVSVKAVAHYASALNMMDDKSDWTATLGRAYANQSSEVMASVQRLRAMAAQQGNLVSTQQQQVVNEGSNYVIAPAQPRVIYVPVYDPIVIYTRPVFSAGFASRYWSWGVGFPIGGWLSYDLDWGGRNVYYNGWNDAYYEYGGGWRARSRPFIQITNVYVSPRYRNVYVNRDVYRRPVDYRNVDRYAGVHRDTYFDNRRGGSRDGRGSYDVDRGRDNDRGRPDVRETDRKAQPREDRPVATPDGYRNGGRDRGAESSQTPPQPNPPRAPRPAVSAPEPRRYEPQARDMSISPVERRAPQPRAEQPRIEQPRIEQPRIEQPRIEQQRNEPPRREREQSAPRQEQPRQSQPRVEQPRQEQSKPSAEQRSAKPRGGRGSGA